MMDFEKAVKGARERSTLQILEKTSWNVPTLRLTEGRRKMLVMVV